MRAHLSIQLAILVGATILPLAAGSARTAATDDAIVAPVTGPAAQTTVVSDPAEAAYAAIDPVEAPRGSPAPAGIAGAIARAALEFGIAPQVLHAIAWHESRYRQDVVSSRGAIGIMQLMPDTARALGIDPTDPVQNIRGGAALLARLRAAYRGDLRLALAAYSAGMGAVHRFGGVPPFAETRDYVAFVLDRSGGALLR